MNILFGYLSTPWHRDWVDPCNCVNGEDFFYNSFFNTVVLLACHFICLLYLLNCNLHLLKLGWTKVETIDSLMRKAGYNGPITEALRKKLHITCYQSTLYTMHYNDYVNYVKVTRGAAPIINGVRPGPWFNMNQSFIFSRAAKISFYTQSESRWVKSVVWIWTHLLIVLPSFVKHCIWWTEELDVARNCNWFMNNLISKYCPAKNSCVLGLLVESDIQCWFTLLQYGFSRRRFLDCWYHDLIRREIWVGCTWHEWIFMVSKV